jgi:homoserine O-acetyltransferase/O-succinyltransferase
VRLKLARAVSSGQKRSRLSGANRDWQAAVSTISTGASLGAFGGSMGALQTDEWAVRYPDTVKRPALIAGTARNTEPDFLAETGSMPLLRTRVLTVVSTVRWTTSARVARGTQDSGLSWVGVPSSSSRILTKRWLSSLDDFIINFMSAYFNVMDANDRIRMAWNCCAGM